MNRLDTLVRAQPVTDVYTNLHGLQQLRAEGDQEEALKKVAQQFESMFLNLLLKNMRSANAVFEEGNPFDSQESRFYRDMHDQQLSLTLSHKASIGLADSFYRQLSSRYGQGVDTYGQNRLADIQNILRQKLQQKNIDAVPSTQKSLMQPTEAAEPISLADTPEDFVELMMPYAEKASSKIGVPSELLIAQAALETGWGKYVLADKNGKSSYNVFNIKADSRWQGDSVSTKTLEYHNGIAQQEQASFRRYKNLQQSFDDYVKFLGESERYQEALNQSDDPKKFIQALQDAGYATDPNYAKKVLTVFNTIGPTG